ncbi:hypothetical protein J6590_031967 [Homalodisca vitripennis]|nr:hypothetical protein J6590_031967 [Homalodisca vitripennis]
MNDEHVQNSFEKGHATKTARAQYLRLSRPNSRSPEAPTYQNRATNASGQSYQHSERRQVRQSTLGGDAKRLGNPTDRSFCHQGWSVRARIIAGIG